MLMAFVISPAVSGLEYPMAHRSNRQQSLTMVRGINRHAGDIVAMVVAETREQARDALDLIEMDFDPMDAVTDIYAAMADGARNCMKNIRTMLLSNGMPAG